MYFKCEVEVDLTHFLLQFYFKFYFKVANCFGRTKCFQNCAGPLLII